jgi:hypothetical protein
LTSVRRTIPIMLAALVLATTAAACSDEPALTSGPTGGSTSPATTTGSTTTEETTPPPSNAESLAGKWDGSWQNSSPDSSSGTFELEWQQDGDTLSGTIEVRGTGCFDEGSVDGTLNGSQIEFGIVSGGAKITYTGAVTNDGLSGTYSANAACGNAEGDWTAVRHT